MSPPAENQPNVIKFQDDMDLGKKCTQARRHIFLIRHGQYQIGSREKDKQVLTQLGMNKNYNYYFEIIIVIFCVIVINKEGNNQR